jgi:type 1 glutamine amidotransferase
MGVLKRHKSYLLIILFAFTSLANSTPLMAKGIYPLQKNKIEKMKKAKIVFLITEDPDNYEAHKTVPHFAEMLRKEHGYDVTVLLGSGDRGSYSYPNMEAVSKADLLVVFARRIALPHKQMDIIKNYLAKGKPLIGIRTANHAFTARDKIGEGFEDWPEFVADILGCENRGYGPVGPGIDVSVVPEIANDPIVSNIKPSQWHSEGNIYLVAPLLDKKAKVLLTGKSNDITQPVAWTRTAGKSKVFYTSLGYPADFAMVEFKTLLLNAIKWALK